MIRMNRFFMAACTAALTMGFQAKAQTPVNTKVLVLNPSGGYSHTSAINALATLLNQQATAWNLTVTVSQSASNFTLPYLRGFDVVFLNNNTALGSVITGAGQGAFSQWMQEGGGAVGLHGALDHSDTWAWYTQNMAKSKFASHSNYCGQPNAKVMVDTVKTAGEVRAKKPEYAALISALPNTPWTWCDEWYSLTSNPRNLVDVLMTIDERTYTPGTPMGDHPVTWTVKLPPLAPGGKQGKFFYSARGHDTPNFSDANTRNMIRFGLCWSSGREMGAASCQTPPTIGITPAGAPARTSFRAEARHGVLQVSVQGEGLHSVEVTSLSGRVVAGKPVNGNGEVRFANLDGFRVYLVQVKTGNRVLRQRIAL